VAKPEPIAFTGFGLNPDTKLEVFGQEFHVISAALKLHSMFFAKFLDSADKISPLLRTEI
jgi:hypothetical protein